MHVKSNNLAEEYFHVTHERSAQPPAEWRLNLPLIDSLIKTARSCVKGRPCVRQLLGGVSRLTYLISYPSEYDFVVKISLDQPRAHGDHGLRREYVVLEQLQSMLQCSPTPVAYHDSSCEPALLIMERCPGQSLLDEAQNVLPLDAVGACSLSKQFIDQLIALHGLDPTPLLDKGIGRPNGYLMRQLEYWEKQYGSAEVKGSASWNEVLQWLADNMPQTTESPTIVHNDFRLDNLLVHSDRPAEITAILDWEMATVGDPLLDLGVMLAYWIEQQDPAKWQNVRWQPSHLPGMLSRQDIVERYAQGSGRCTKSVVFYYVLGLFRKACITRNLYLRREAPGEAETRRFIFLNGILREMAELSISRGSIW